MTEVRVGVLTCSNTRAQGLAQDTAGLALVEFCEQRGWNVVAYHVCPTEIECLSASLIEMTDVDSAQIVLTCGGIGLDAMDVVPEATELVCERLVPGIVEHIRARCMEQDTKAMFSRGVAGLREGSLIVNLDAGADAAGYTLGLLAEDLESAVSPNQTCSFR